MAKTKQVARKSTGGKAPRHDLARAAARQTKEYDYSATENVISVKWAPSRERHYRNTPFKVLLGNGQEARAVLRNWTDHARGFIIAFRGKRSLAETPWLKVETLYLLSDDCLVVSEGDRAPMDTSALQNNPERDWAVVNYIAYCKGRAEDGTRRDAIYLKGSDAHGTEQELDFLASIFQHEGTGISFKQAQVHLNSNSLYDGPLHEYALRMYQEVSSLVNDLTATAQYQGASI